MFHLQDIGAACCMHAHAPPHPTHTPTHHAHHAHAYEQHTAGRSGLYIGPPVIAPLIMETRIADYYMGQSADLQACTRLYDK